MKLQLQGQRVRFRVDEAELARLLSGETLVNLIELGTDVQFTQWLVLGAGEGAGTMPSLVVRDGGWQVTLPADAVQAYASQLPCRHALVFVIDLGAGGALELDFEVDVRDSLKARGPRLRPATPG